MRRVIEEKPVVRLPQEILAMVFSFLPTKDIKAVALVSKAWKAVTKHPKFWTKVQVKISREDIEEKLRSDRFGVIGRVQLVEDLTLYQLKLVLIRLKNFQQKNPSPQELRLRVENKRFGVKTKSKTVVVSFLQTISEATQLELKYLSLLFIDLSSVQPQVLAQAVVRVEEANLACTKLTDEQVSTVLTTIVNTECLTLKRLSLLGNNISPVPPDLLAQVVIKLEDPNKVMVGATKQQILAICKKIVRVDKQHLKTKMIDLSYYREIYNLSKDILLAISLKTELRGYRRPSKERTSDSDLEDSDEERKFIFTTDSDSDNFSSESDLESDSENVSANSDSDSED